MSREPLPVLDEIAQRVAAGLGAASRHLVRRRASRYNQVDRYLVSGFCVVEVEILPDVITVADDYTATTLQGKEAVRLAPVLVLELLAKHLPSDDIRSVERISADARAVLGFE